MLQQLRYQQKLHLVQALSCLVLFWGLECGLGDFFLLALRHDDLVRIHQIQKPAFGLRSGRFCLVLTLHQLLRKLRGVQLLQVRVIVVLDAHVVVVLQREFQIIIHDVLLELDADFIVLASTFLALGLVRRAADDVALTIRFRIVVVQTLVAIYLLFAFILAQVEQLIVLCVNA